MAKKHMRFLQTASVEFPYWEIEQNDRQVRVRAAIAVRPLLEYRQHVLDGGGMRTLRSCPTRRTKEKGRLQPYHQVNWQLQ